MWLARPKINARTKIVHTILISLTRSDNGFFFFGGVLSPFTHRNRARGSVNSRARSDGDFEVVAIGRRGKEGKVLGGDRG